MSDGKLVGGHDLRRRGLKDNSESPSSPNTTRSPKDMRSPNTTHSPKGYVSSPNTTHSSKGYMSSPGSASDYHEQDSMSPGSYSRSTISYRSSDDSFTSLNISHNASVSSQSTTPTNRRGPSNKLSPRQKVKKDLKANKMSETSIKSPVVISSVAVGAIVILICVILTNSQNKSAVQTQNKDYFQEFKKNLGRLKEQFPSQSDRFWRVIGTTVKQVIVNDEPQHPAVLLITAPESHAASRSSSCLAYQLLQNINQIYDFHESPYIDSSSLDHSSKGNEKLDLDDNLKKKLHNRSMGVVIDHIEVLSPAASLLFHGYCDGDNAPFKKVTIALVYHSHLAKEDLTEKLVERTLANMWSSDLDEDKIPALLSRIANNVVMISEENNIHLSRVCPDFI